MFNITVKNLDSLVEAFTRAPLVVDESLQKGVKEAGRIVLEIEKTEAPVGTGKLRREIEFVYKPISAMVYPKMDYAVYVNFGTGLFGPKNSLIYPKKAKMLRWKSGGQYVFARYTRGMKANPFVGRTVSKAEPRINTVVDNLLKDLKI